MGQPAERSSPAGKQNDSKEEPRGLVFSVQRFSLQDGPGIRTTVFLKGCPLRCRWCSNPESQNFEPEILYRARNCQQCGTCAAACKAGAIRFEEGAPPRITRESCTACGDCVRACPAEALEISGRWMGVEELVREAARDRPFYRNSGGGVTLSGGEPLSQAAFARNLLEQCRREGLQTCLDTSGHAPWKTLESVLAHTDVILFDLKHPGAAPHQKQTGVDNLLIMDNLSRVAGSGLSRIWVRVPLIPGFNDSEETIAELAEVLQGKKIEKISLLGYHEWGRAKYQALGRSYPMGKTDPCTKETLERASSLLETRGLTVTIGH